MGLKIYLSFLFIALSLSLVSASFNLENYSIAKTYGAGENLKGWINISFQNEPANSILKLNSQGNLSLLEFLNINYAQFSCFPEDCGDNYKTISGENSKTFTLSTGEEKVLAFKVTGSVNEINSLRFKVEVNNAKTCISPLKIDLLDNGNYNWESGNYSEEITCTYSGGKGCFEDSGTSLVPIADTPYCEKIYLRKSGKFKLGAWVSGAGAWHSGLLRMKLYNLDNAEEAGCNLPEPSAGGSEISCEIEFENPELEEYYVCISSDSGVTNYKTKKENNAPCGFFAFPGEETAYFDYYIFAKSAKFNEIGSFIFDKESFQAQNDEELKYYIDDYINEVYNKNCVDGCSIPIKFHGFQNIAVSISDISINFSTSGSAGDSDNKIYNAEKESAKISSDFLKLNLDNSGLKVPSSLGNQTITISLEEEIFSEDVEIKEVAGIRRIYPLSVAAAVPSIFYADVEGNKTIVEYKWFFGTGNETQTTAENKAEFAYPDIGTYTLTLTIKDSEGNSVEKDFAITVSSPKDIANSTLADYRSRVENMRDKINNFPGWYKKFAEDEVGFGELDSKLIGIEQDYREAQITSDYIDVMKKIIELKVPSEIKIEKSEIPKLVYPANIDVASLGDLGAGDAGEEKEYQDAVAGWFNMNIDAKLEYEIISLVYEPDIDNKISRFNLKIKPKKDVRNGYLILEADLTNARWKQDYEQEYLNGKTGIVLTDLKQDEEKEIEFASTYIEPESFVVYLSPELSELAVEIEPCNYNNVCEKNLGEDYKNCRNDCKPWGWVALWISILLLGALIVYIVLQQWYKRNYEKILFKNKNDLFNLASFINNAESKGISKGEIKSKLKQQGWKREQINYAFKKAGGGFVGGRIIRLFSQYREAGNKNQS